MKRKFKIGDRVTFSDKCPKVLRYRFAKGSKKIIEITAPPHPYCVGTVINGCWFDARELKLVKK
jgi:hypothetical protein